MLFTFYCMIEAGVIVMNILFVIQRKLNQLSKAERKLAEWILQHSEEVIHMNVKSLSKVSDTSPATVMRLCYSLGLDGFTDLKLKLSANLPEIQENLYSDIIANESIESIKKKIKLKVIDAISNNEVMLSTETINEVINLIEKSIVIYTYGLGASGIVAEDFAQKFLRVGHQVISSQDIHLLITSMVTTKLPRFLFLISNSGEKKEVCRLARLAKKYNIPVVSMTSVKSSTLSSLSDIVIEIADSGEAILRSSATNSLLVQLYTIDVIFSTYTSKNYSKIIKQLSESKEATQIFENSE